jgi:hypothetical protein
MENGDGVEEQKPPTKGVVWVRYAEEGKEPVVLKLNGNPFEVVEQVRARMCPGVEILAFDEKFSKVMAAR